MMPWAESVWHCTSVAKKALAQKTQEDVELVEEAKNVAVERNKADAERVKMEAELQQLNRDRMLIEIAINPALFAS